jgi:hypothetical protein
MHSFAASSARASGLWVLKYQHLKNLVVLVTEAAYCAATFLGQQMKLCILTEKLLVISQRFFGIPPFRFYALADGIRRVLSGGTFQPPQESPPGTQLELALVWSA